MTTIHIELSTPAGFLDQDDIEVSDPESITEDVTNWLNNHRITLAAGDTLTFAKHT